MAKLAIDGVLNCSEKVRSRIIGGVTYIQVWNGSSTVNVYRDHQELGHWFEVTVWTTFGPAGGSPEWDDVRAGMMDKFDEIGAYAEGDR